MTDLSGNVALLLAELCVIPPDLAKLRSELSAGKYTPEEVTQAVTHFVSNECFYESGKFYDCDYPFTEWLSPPQLWPDLHSTYLYDIVKLTLEYGLDPLAEYDFGNIFWYLRFIDNEYVGADTYALLFENGVDPNAYIEGSLFFDAELEFDVFFDAFNQYDRRLYDALVHCWFVFLGYGATSEDGRIPIDIFDNEKTNNEYGLEKFKISDLRDHRQFTFALSNVKNHGRSWSLQVFDKKTLWEVARL